MSGVSDYGLIRDAIDVVKSDSAENKFDAFRNGDSVAGNIRVTLAISGKTHIFANVQPGNIIRAKVNKIFSSNTTVTKVEGLLLE